MGVNAARGINADIANDIDFAVGGEIEVAAFVFDRLHHRWMRQRFERVMQLHARQSLAQRAVLTANGLGRQQQ